MFSTLLKISILFSKKSSDTQPVENKSIYFND